MGWGVGGNSHYRTIGQSMFTFSCVLQAIAREQKITCAINSILFYFSKWEKWLTYTFLSLSPSHINEAKKVELMQPNKSRIIMTKDSSYIQ
ncbi:hypothetical protein MIMGU_mgv1a017167mg [Erythranthe guttata]|uniref:Uncharacterized protein n=1 Tax=Erythranthe guttata TaxID=4155 RepID=A0A022RN20_ERYGU|nr:hypothetical protein MIMGU_mgv1a017167mg [Erythranthe guttata]